MIILTLLELKKMKMFRVNEYITLKLENSKTNIYVNEKNFIHCKFLLLGDLHIGEIEDFISNFSSVDEEEGFANSYEYKQFTNARIPPETEFWGHCSNLQVWAENNYNSRLLHSNLAFPLLKKLVEAGDVKAKKVFKEEIAKRLESGFPTVVEYLIQEDYIKYLTHEEILFSVLVSGEPEILLEIESNLSEIGKENFDLVVALDYHLAPCFTVKNKHVTGIDLIDCGLDFLPESVGDLSHLESLDLTFNKLDLSKDLLAKLCNIKTFYW